MTLVEMMVALIIIAVILAAAASSLITLTLQSAVNEHRVQATAYLTSLHEEVQGVPWDRAVLYEDELYADEAKSDLEDLEAAFGESLGGDRTFEGEDIATIPGPSNTACPETDLECGRVPFVPRPVDVVTIDGREFDLFQLITERSTVEPHNEIDIRRFVTIVRWRLLGREYEEVFESQRAPSPAERRQAEDPDLRLLLVSPRVIELTSEGKNASEITVLARYRAGTDRSRVRFPTDGDGGESVFEMTRDSLLGDPLTERGAWEVTISPEELEFDDCDDNAPSCLRTVEVLGTGPSELTIEGARNITLIPHEFVAGGGDREPPSITNVEPAAVDTVVEIGIGSEENELCKDLKVIVDAEAHEDDGKDGELEVRIFFTARDSTSRSVPLGELTGRFELTFPAGQTAPWALEEGETYKDRFYVIASAGGGEGRFSTYVSSGVLTINKEEGC